MNSNKNSCQRNWIQVTCETKRNQPCHIIQLLILFLLKCSQTWFSFLLPPLPAANASTRLAQLPAFGGLSAALTEQIYSLIWMKVKWLLFIALGKVDQHAWAVCHSTWDINPSPSVCGFLTFPGNAGKIGCWVQCKKKQHMCMHWAFNG